MDHINQLPFQYLRKLGDQMTAESNNPHDRHHLGKLILKQLRQYPDDINQIDGRTGASESNGSILARSIRLARALQDFGLKVGDVLMLMAPNHLDLCIPYYASFYIGAINMAVNTNLNKDDLTEMLHVGKPKIIFCQSLKFPMVQEVIKTAGLDTKIVVFGDTFCRKVRSLGAIEQTFPKPTRMMLIFSPLQWITAHFSYIYSAIFVVTRLQTSEQTVTQEHAYYLINRYRPTWTFLNCHLATMLLQSPDYKKCDFSSLETIFVGGGAVSLSILDTLKGLTNGEVMDSYGMSEAGGFALASYRGQVRGSSGVAMPTMLYKIVDLKTGIEVQERQMGELLIKGPSSYFKGYYKNEKATKEAFAEGGWFRTGDIFYQDGKDYFFVDRTKLMLEYKHHLISPIEVELVIRQHPDVVDVAVAGYPHAEDVDHITACVVRKMGSRVTAQDIKDLVKAQLDDTKQLRGGVIFLDQMPLTHNSKLNRMKIKEIIMSEKRH